MPSYPVLHDGRTIGTSVQQCPCYLERRRSSGTMLFALMVKRKCTDQLWFYSWSSQPETYEEFECSYSLLNAWLCTNESKDPTSPRKSGRLGTAMCDRWAEFILTKIYPHKLKFVFAKRLNTRSFDLRTTSNTEG
jgi:hypothetical protein